MEAGKLNRRITIQRPVKTRNRSGQIQVTGWEDIATVWAGMKCTDTKTATSEGVIVHEGLYRFTIRWRDGITAECRVVYGDPPSQRVFPLVGPPADWEGERLGLTLLCKEVG